VVDHIVTDDAADVLARTEPVSNTPVTIDYPIAFGQRVLGVIPKMDGVFGNASAWAAYVFENVVTYDPIPGPVTIDSSNVILRANAGSIFKKAIFNDAAITVLSSSGRNLQHLLIGIDKANIRNKRPVSIQLTLYLYGVVRHPAYGHVMCGKSITLNQKHVTYTATHALTLDDDTITVTVQTSDRYAIGNYVQKVIQKVCTIFTLDQLVATSISIVDRIN
jgi:hypothetical protein